MIRILGLDPGMSHIGISLGLFRKGEGLEIQNVWYIGTQKDKKKKDLRAKADDTRRLQEIVDAVGEIMRHNSFDVVAFEECPSISQNATTTRKVATAWGAVFALAMRFEGRLFYEYSPRTLKYVVTGNKSASKEAMIETLENRHPVLANYELAKSKREHIADACAAAEVACGEPAVIALANAYGRAL